MKKRKYTVDEKIKFYKNKIVKLHNKLAYALDRLEALENTPKQDWDSDLQKDLERKKTLALYGIEE